MPDQNENPVNLYYLALLWVAVVNAGLGLVLVGARDANPLTILFPLALGAWAITQLRRPN